MIKMSKKKLRELEKIVEKGRKYGKNTGTLKEMQEQYEKVEKWVFSLPNGKIKETVKYHRIGQDQQRFIYENLEPEVLDKLNTAYFSIGWGDFVPAREQWEELSKIIAIVNRGRYFIRP